MSDTHADLDRHHLALLLKATEILGSTLDLQVLLDALMDQVVECIGAERGFVMLADEPSAAADEPASWRIRNARAFAADLFESDGFRISRSVVQSVIAEGLPILTNDAHEDPRLRDQVSVSLYHLRSILCVPLATRRRVLGVIYADHTLVRAVFTPRHLTLLEAIARAAAMAVENARLYERLQRVHEESMAQARRELAQAQAQLVHSAKMAAVGRLAAGVAHEINTPLSAVSLNVSVVAEHISEARDRRRLDLAMLAADRCKGIVQKLLRFSHATTEPAKPVDVGLVITDALALVEHELLRDGIAVRRTGEDDLRVEGRDGDLMGVLLNLLMNACDALRTVPPERSRAIEVRARREPPAQTDASTACDAPHGWVCVEIADNGPGLSAEARDHLFEPFFTTHAVGDGLGLGLSISHQIVAEHRGSLSATSPPQGGATFTVRLPGAHRGTQ